MLEIPKTELTVSPLGLGTVHAGVAWSEPESHRMMDAYVDLGGNLLDTARVYSDWVPSEIGRSERVVGDWLQQSKKRNQIVLMTKGGHPKDGVPHRMTAQDMRYDVELSLKTLRVNEIDIYFYHRDDVSLPVEETIETMETFRREGKIRYYACSNWSAERILAADNYCREQGYRGFVANEALMNLGTKQMGTLSDPTLEVLGADLMAYHQANPQNVAMPYSGIAGGYFHRYINGVIRDNDSYHTPENAKLAERCKTLMEKYDATISQVVLGFFTTQPFACVPLYGPKSIAELADAMKYSVIKFDPADFII
jgi:Predicted oxidoreductases (related to aryl-alcohol dehydrogenases)